MKLSSGEDCSLGAIALLIFFALFYFYSAKYAPTKSSSKRSKFSRRRRCSTNAVWRAIDEVVAGEGALGEGASNYL